MLPEEDENEDEDDYEGSEIEEIPTEVERIVSTITDDDSEDDETETTDNAPVLMGLSEAIEVHPMCVILGAPGMGKTTSLKQLVTEAAWAYQTNPDDYYLPVWIDLVTWQDGQRFENLLASYSPTKDFSQIALFLDNLSLTGSRNIQALSDWLETDNAPEHVVVACRAAVYRNELEIPILPIDSLKIEQVEDLLNPSFINRSSYPIFRKS